MWARQVLLFVDCLTHGAARRSNPGVRRTIWHRSDSEPPSSLVSGDFLARAFADSALPQLHNGVVEVALGLHALHRALRATRRRYPAPPPPAAYPRVLSRLLGFSKRRVHRPKPAPCLHRRPALRPDAAHRTSRGSGRGVRGGGAVSAAAPFAHSLFFKKLVHRWGSAYFAAEAEAAEAEADE